MRPSPFRHPLAVLRHTIGLNQKEMGDLVSRSSRTIQSIELGRHALSEDLAYRIAVETSVALPWLLDGDPDAEPYVWGADTIPYTKEHYERTRGLISRGVNPHVTNVVGEQVLRENLGEEAFQHHMQSDATFSGNWTDQFTTTLRSLFAAISAADRVGRQDIAIHRLSRFVDSMTKDFGQAIDPAFLDRYKELLENCAGGVDDAKSLLKESGDILWSPYLPKDQWKQEYTIADIMLPKDSDAQRYLEIHGTKALEPILREGLKVMAAELDKRKSKGMASKSTKLSENHPTD